MQEDLFAHLRYKVRKDLGVSIAEYFYLDMVHQLSHNRWCTKSVELAAEDMGITPRGLQKMRTRLIEAGYIKRNIKGHLKTTDKYYNVAVAPIAKKGVNSVRKGVNSVREKGELSSYKNNNRTTENKGVGDFEGTINRMYGRKPTVLPRYVLDERAA